MRPTIPLTPGPDGNFYGTTSLGGTGGGGVLFKISPGGSYTLLNNTFGDRFVTPQLGGANSVTIPSDGHLYLTTGAGLVQMTLQGEIKRIWRFDDNPALGEGFMSGLLEAHDGCLYGTTVYGKQQTGGTVYKVTPQGVVSTIHRFGDGTVANDGLTPIAALVEGPDGNLYGVTSKGGAFGQGVVFRMTTAGVVTILHSFGDAAQSNFWVAPSATLVLGSDRCFYGSTGAALFKITSTGVYTEFPQVPFYTHGYAPPALSAADGNIYVSTSRMLYRVTPSGVTTAVCAITHGGQGLVQGHDGAFYFTSIYGFNSSANGAVYRLTLANRVIEGISPASVQAGHGDFFLTITGSGFLPYDTISCGGCLLPTTLGSGSLLRVTIPAWLVTSPQALKLFVVNDNETPTLAPSLAVTAAPTLTRLSPTSVQAGHASFTLSVGGTGFANGARVHLYSTVLPTTYIPTTYISPTLLTATISAAQVAQAESGGGVTVKNPNVAETNMVPFLVTEAPSITTFSPASVQAGHRDFTLTIDGQGFVRGCTLFWNNAAMTTGFVSPTQLVVNVPAAYVSKYGSPQLNVVNPGIAPSSSVRYTVADPIFLTWLSRDSIKPGLQNYSLTLMGANFVSGARAYWNGQVLSTTYVSPSQLTAVINGAYVKAGVPGKVTVTNPYVLPTAPLTITVTP